MKFHVFIDAFLSLFICLPVFADQTRDEEKGKILFENHGCTNCHGASGTVSLICLITGYKIRKAQSSNKPLSIP